MRNDKKKVLVAVTILLLLIGIGIGYAALSTSLNINGTSSISKHAWNVHFENVRVTNGSVSAVKDATIDSNTTNLSYEIKLAKPGDFYEFTVDIKNAGSIDAMISEILKTELTVEQVKYISYSISYSDNTKIISKDKLESGETKSIIVRVEFKTDITVELLPSVDQSLNLALNLTYVQADSTAVSVPVSFVSDSWDTIIKNVRAGRVNSYQLGNTKKVDMGSLGVHTVRVANTTTPAECEAEGFSQSACGFVVEFADIITNHAMNSIETNVGGWPSSAMRSYTQNTIYPELSTELQSGIIDTKVVSSHGSDDISNFTSIDKLYLLSTKEVWGDNNSHNTAAVETRQLDYYNNINVTTTNYSGAIKQNGDSVGYWWLRSAYDESRHAFYRVDTTGGWNGFWAAHYSYGVSPAFRIG